MPTNKEMIDTTAVEALKAELQALAAGKPKRVKREEAVRELLPLVRAALDLGYSLAEIATLAHEKTGMSPTVFRKLLAPMLKSGAGAARSSSKHTPRQQKPLSLPRRPTTNIGMEVSTSITPTDGHSVEEQGFDARVTGPAEDLAVDESPRLGRPKQFVMRNDHGEQI